MDHKITIFDLAKDVNLSPGMVSKILNGKANVPDSTQERVILRAKELGYVANQSARNLKAKKSWTIGVVFSDIAYIGLEHPFFGSIIQAFKNYIELKGYELVFIPKKLGDQEQTYLQWARNKNVDGILVLTGDVNNPDMYAMTHSEIPCVSTDVWLEGMSTVISHDEAGIQLAYDHLKSIGCQRIFAFSGNTLSRAYEERTQAYQAVSKEDTLPPFAYYMAEQYGYDNYVKSAQHWIKEWRVKPDGVIAFSDEMAMALIHVLHTSGLRVPEDIAVTGYDDIQFAKLFSPSLTTLRQNKKAIAVRAAEKLLSMIDGLDLPKNIEKIPVELIIRGSTKR
jgi:DNA-binding LacI/PurR family transcriptional regulator